jgi:hypothetical protein
VKHSTGIGEYRHVPGQMLRPGPDGRLQYSRVRRRFPHLGFVCLVYALLLPVLFAGLGWLFQRTSLRAYAPRRMVEDAPLPPSPSLDNVLFGVGAAEAALAGLFIGWLLWRWLWHVRAPAAAQERGFWAVWPLLLRRGLWLGVATVLMSTPILTFGLYMRTAPTEQPLLVRPFFAVLATVPLLFTAMLTVIPVVLVCIGLLLGALTATAVAVLWQHFPEEPVAE